MCRILYLDQKAWIELAQGAWDRDKHPQQHVALSYAIDAVKGERLIIPLSFVNLYETLKINDRIRRTHLAHLQTTLSAGMVFRGRRRILRESMLRHLADRLGRCFPESPSQWFLSRIFIESAADYTPEVFGPDIPVSLVELIRKNPESALFSYLTETDEEIRRRGVKQFSSASVELISRIEARRASAASEAFPVRRRAYGASLIIDELDFVFMLASELGLRWTTVRDIGPALLKSLVTDVPILNVERELVVRLEDQNRAIHENDLRDISSFSAALPLSDVLVGEKPLVNAARQARLGEKYNTTLLTSVSDLLAIKL